MSILSSFVRKISAPVATIASVIPNPVAQAVGIGASAIARDTARRDFKRAQERDISSMADFSDFATSSGAVRVPAYRPSNDMSGNRGFLGGVNDFFTSAGEVVKSAFGSGIPQLFGLGRPRGTGQQPAVTTVTNVGAQESQGSGSIQAGMGSLLPTVVGAARGLLKSPLGQLGTGTAIGTGLSLIGSDGKPMRMTRKMKAQARSLLNMTGGNLSLTADFLGISEEALVALLLKRFRNDGPVVTKAALRKTKSTIRKLKNMCDMYDDLRPAARRRTPMRRATRASTTLIKN
tara:strand:- start:96 stop:965 length:870 start_codon:yes stop_codon:yes gene_type:complete